MNRKWTLIGVASAGCCTLVGVPVILSGQTAEKKPIPKATKVSSTAPATPARSVKGKPLSKNVRDGLAWLVERQHENGGWDQGEESMHMSGASRMPAPGSAAGKEESAAQNSNSIRDSANVADTAMAALSLIRAGSTPSQGEHAKNIRKAVEFVCGEVEEADAKSLFVTQTRNTRLQSKLGPYIDTFLASMLLAEVKGEMPDSDGNKRVAAAFDKVMDKIEKNQKQDGTWDNNGWAPVLSQSMASKAINRSAQRGGKVNEEVRQRAELYARGQFDAASGGFGGGGSAGVPLYAGAASVGAMQDSENTNLAKEKEAREKLRTAKTEPERKDAEQTLKRIAGNRVALAQAQDSIINKLDDKQFAAGFGSNGGEEFLSHMYIGESLVAKGGEDWKKWDTAMTENLNRIQNGDGSWSGHHCITGRTFCTAAALMVLTVDRAPVPVAGKIKRQ